MYVFRGVRIQPSISSYWLLMLTQTFGQSLHYFDWMVESSAPVPSTTVPEIPSHIISSVNNMIKDWFKGDSIVVWEAYHKGVPLLGVPENPTDGCPQTSPKTHVQHVMSQSSLNKIILSKWPPFFASFSHLLAPLVGQVQGTKKLSLVQLAILWGDGCRMGGVIVQQKQTIHYRIPWGMRWYKYIDGANTFNYCFHYITSLGTRIITWVLDWGSLCVL